MTKNTQLVLTKLETQEIERVFKDAKDFRSIGERITTPIDELISKTAKIIDKDPIMNVSKELKKMNNDVQDVYKELIDNDGKVMKLLKSVPLVGNIANVVDKKLDEAKFNMKTMEGKVNVIFSGFDQSYESINSSIEIQKSFLDELSINIEKVIAYKNFISQKISEFKERLENTEDELEKEKLGMFIRNVEFFQGNLIVLIGNLEMARKRLLMRLDSATKLSLAMNSSRPIFKTLLSTALVETSSQKAIDASIKTIGIMGETIDRMSSELTDKAIETSKKSEELSNKPILSTTIFIENVTKLKNYFDEIDDYREQIKIEAEKEVQAIEEAKTRLNEIKVISKEGHEELAKELLK